MTEEYKEFKLNVPMTTTKGLSSRKTIGASLTETTYDAKAETKRAIALVGDHFYHGAFFPAEELEKAHKGWEGTLHDVNHQGTTDVRGLSVSANVLYFVGYNDNVQYDTKNRSMSMDIHYDEKTQYGKAVKAYVGLCEKAGQTPNVSVAFMAKTGTMKASELPESVNYTQYGLSEDDEVIYIYDVVPQALSTVLVGACSSDKGCGIGMAQTDKEQPDLSDEELDKIETEKQAIIDWLKKEEKSND